MDIKNIITFVLRIWLYLSPSLYSVERIPEKFRTVFMLNPFATIFMSYRKIIMYGNTPDMKWVLYAFLISLIMLLGGFWFFIREERNLAKVV